MLFGCQPHSVLLMVCLSGVWRVKTRGSWIRNNDFYVAAEMAFCCMLQWCVPVQGPFSGWCDGGCSTLFHTTLAGAAERQSKSVYDYNLNKDCWYSHKIAIFICYNVMARPPRKDNSWVLPFARFLYKEHLHLYVGADCLASWLNGNLAVQPVYT